MEATKAAVPYLTKEVGFHRVQAKCCLENMASERVMQKVGMKKEGVFRQLFYGKDGMFHDVVIYAILADEI